MLTLIWGYAECLCGFRYLYGFPQVVFLEHQRIGSGLLMRNRQLKSFYIQPAHALMTKFSSPEFSYAFYKRSLVTAQRVERGVLVVPLRISASHQLGFYPVSVSVKAYCCYRKKGG